MTKMWAAVALTALVLATGGRAADPPGRTDPALAKVSATAEAVKGTEARQVKLEADLIRDLDAFLAAAGPLTPELEKLTADKLRALAAALHATGKRLLAFHKDYEAGNKAVAAAYAQAPAAFRAAAAAYRKFAAEEPFEQIKQDYMKDAELNEARAAWYEKRAAALPEEAKEVRETLKFVDRMVLYLERHDVTFVTLPDASVGAARERFLDTLKTFVDGYKGFRGSMDKFHEKLKEEVADPRPRPVGQGGALSPPPAPTVPAPAPPAVAALMAADRRK